MKPNDAAIYALLPNLFRRLDTMTGGPLKALTGVLEAAREELADDIAGLYEDWFVGTCRPHILPHLAALTGAALPDGAQNPRALLADQIALARRKGTAGALERVVSDLTGWSAQLVNDATPGKARLKIRCDAARWLYGVTPRAVGHRVASDAPARFWLHPLGVDCQMVAGSRCQPALDATFDPEYDAPIALSQHSSHALVTRNLALRWMDDAGSWMALPPERIGIADLAEWSPVDHPHAVLVDPGTGRMQVHDAALAGRVWQADFACGGLPVRPPAPAPAPAPTQWVAHVGGADSQAPGSMPYFDTLASALAAYREVPGDGLILICDSATHSAHRQIVTDRCRVCPAEPNSPRRLIIAAAPGETPVLSGEWRARANGVGLELDLRGLWIDGHIAIRGAVRLRLEHCSIQPIRAMRDSLAGLAALRLTPGRHCAPSLSLSHCFVGAVLGEGPCAIAAVDSVIDGYGCLPALATAGAVRMDRSTVLGATLTGALTARDCLFAAPVRALDPDAASADHCVLPGTSTAAHQQACHHAPVAPDRHFRSLVLGSPGYAQLRRDAPRAWHQGASDGGEVGAFNRLRNSRKTELLAQALRDYVPLAVEVAVEWV